MFALCDSVLFISRHQLEVTFSLTVSVVIPMKISKKKRSRFPSTEPMFDIVLYYHVILDVVEQLNQNNASFVCVPLITVCGFIDFHKKLSFKMHPVLLKPKIEDDVGGHIRH